MGAGGRAGKVGTAQAPSPTGFFADVLGRATYLLSFAVNGRDRAAIPVGPRPDRSRHDTEPFSDRPAYRPAAGHGECRGADEDPENAREDIAPSLADPATEIIDLEEERNRRLTLPVTVDGHGPYRFMIDTGSEATAITRPIVEVLGHPPAARAIVIGMASRRPADIVELDRLEFGSRVVRNLYAPVLERRHVGADGILGLDALQAFRVLFDFT